MEMEMEMEVEVKMQMQMQMQMQMKMVLICAVCVIEHHNTQYAPVDTTNRDNERSQPKRQHNGVRDAKVPKRQKQRQARRQCAGWARRRRLRPLLLASTTKSAHTGAGATPRNWLPAGTDGPSTEQR